MPPESLFQFLQSQMAPAQAVSTGVAHDEINSLIYKKKEIEPSLLDFIKSNISTVGGLNPEDTTLGKAITQIVQEQGNPYVMPIHSQKIRYPQVNTQVHKDYLKEKYGTILPELTSLNYNKFKEYIPDHSESI